MPRVVDPVTRRRQVVDAVFRLAIRDGLASASLRNVADEAGLNIGSVRHYFDSHQQLMLFAMREMLDRVARRLMSRVERLPDLAEVSPKRRRELLADLLEQLLPLDEARRAEVTVWIEFVTAARTYPALADLAHETAAGAREVVRRVLTRALAAGEVRAELDLDREVGRLWALIDGLSLNAVLNPDLVGPSDCVAALHAHLDELRRPAAYS
ncbi:TetR/AcrR family transcriptional regulator [Pseudonocardia acaciae]|uniref:TetR/AcrR family transcriptional regulator n=1 Tax=Pseudonocardia acaciae TaxID=551276 RepID=UPI00048E539D|nr:TetR/AcrR family transcriptional regulator [Pseudonocardia acaciae]